MSKQQLNTLEKIQKDAVTKTNSISSTTPYQGIIYECGLMPITYTGCPRKKVTDLIMASAKDLA